MIAWPWRRRPVAPAHYVVSYDGDAYAYATFNVYRARAKARELAAGGVTHVRVVRYEAAGLEPWTS
jgi:hypothetical protein